MRGKEIISAVMGRILILGFGVQILFGVIWAFCHLGYYQEFPDSDFLASVAKTLVCDEYTGILYPLLIRICQGITKAAPIPYFSVLYILQLCVAGLATWHFLGGMKAFRKGSPLYRTLAMLSVLTLPVAMQCHMAVLPVSLASSVFLLQAGVFLRAWPEPLKAVNISADEEQVGTVRTLTKLGILGLMEGLLLPEYRFFGAILTAFYAIMAIAGSDPELDSDLDKKGFRILKIALVTAVFLGMGATLSNWFTQEGAYGRMQNSVEAAAFRRFAWDDFGEFYSQWPQELRDALTQEEIAIGNVFPIEKERILGAKVDAVYGREKAREIYGKAQAAAGKARFKRNLKEIIKDFICYAFAQPAQLFLMEGRGQTTLSGRNLDVMRANMPKLSMLYVRYGYIWSVAAGMLALVVRFLQLSEMELSDRKIRIRQICFFALICAAISLWYVMQGGGIMDYKNSLPVTLLWGMWMCPAFIVIQGHSSK